MSGKLILLTTAAALLATSACEARERNQPTPPEARVSITDAIVAAQQHSNGKAVRAEYEQQKDGRWVYDVKVRSGAGLSEVRVHPDKGNVLGMRDATNDDDDNDDNRD